MSSVVLSLSVARLVHMDSWMMSSCRSLCIALHNVLLQVFKRFEYLFCFHTSSGYCCCCCFLMILLISPVLDGWMCRKYVCVCVCVSPVVQRLWWWYVKSSAQRDDAAVAVMAVSFNEKFLGRVTQCFFSVFFLSFFSPVGFLLFLIGSVCKIYDKCNCLIELKQKLVQCFTICCCYRFA